MRHLIRDINEIVKENKFITYNDKEIINELVKKNILYKNNKELKKAIFNKLKDNKNYKLLGNKKTFSFNLINKSLNDKPLIAINKLAPENLQHTQVEKTLEEIKDRKSETIDLDSSNLHNIKPPEDISIRKEQKGDEILENFLNGEKILFKSTRFAIVGMISICLLENFFFFISHQILFYLLLSISAIIIIKNSFKRKETGLTFDIKFNEFSLIFTSAVVFSFLYVKFIVSPENLQENNLESWYFFDVYQFFFFTIILLIVKNINLIVKYSLILALISIFFIFFKENIEDCMNYFRYKIECYSNINQKICNPPKDHFTSFFSSFSPMVFTYITCVILFAILEKTIKIKLFNDFIIKSHEKKINFLLDFFEKKYTYVEPDKEKNIITNKFNLLYIFFISVFFLSPDKIEDIYYAKNTEPNMGHCVNIDDDTIISKNFGRIIIDKKYLTDTDIKEYVIENDIKDRFFYYKCEEGEY